MNTRINVQPKALEPCFIVLTHEPTFDIKYSKQKCNLLKRGTLTASVV
jgi:hypothetical protein